MLQLKMILTLFSPTAVVNDGIQMTSNIKYAAFVKC